MIKAVIFDFDGVIFNTEEPVFKLIKKLCKRYGYSFKTKEEFKELYNINFFKSMEKFGIKGKKLDRFKKECEQELEKLHLHIFQSIPVIIRELSRHYYLAVISSNFYSILAYNLKKKKLLTYFSLLVGADKIESKVKRLKYCLEKFSIKPSEAVYVGDTAGDLEEAKKARIKTLAVTWGFHTRAMLKKESPTLIASKPAQLLKILKVKKKK